MTNILTKQPSPQAVEVYRLLEKHGAMSAKDIGKQLKIFPNAVYREVKQLLALGFVEEIFSYPVEVPGQTCRRSYNFLYFHG